MVDFFSQHDPQFTSAEQLRSIIESAAAAGNVRGMRTIRRDLLSMSEGLAPDDRAALTTLLAAQARDDPFDRAG